MEITIDGSQFEYRTDYQDDKALRASFDSLAGRVFGNSFERWFQEGYWDDRYRVHSLFSGGRVVANISDSPLDFQILGRGVHAVQLGTVMTDAEFRNRGLQHFLMARVLTDWADKCDAVFLYANSSVLDFYPKFGFAPAREYLHSLRLEGKAGGERVRRLDLSRQADRTLLLERYGRGNPLSLCSCEHSPGLLMYECLGALRESVYYLEESRAVAIAEADGATLHLHDVFAPAGCTLPKIAAALAGPETRRVVLGFTPRDGAACSVRPLREKESTLFFLNGKKDLFGARQLRFPLLFHT